ncbi:DUF4157 domain-containing protein [Streptomyces sp. NPDC059092]|uniref:eCIS core domain-containing protein n=1 Tax=Streptomyces sp. NPDC059092 TaxID=3346725 RepID=UPI0036834460
MSAHTSSAASQEARSAQEAGRRKRKERAAASRTPEPKDIVSGAGQPLDLSVRRELEEQLGHDFSRVRLHTDRDAGTLTDLLGADAVAVGQDIFFREGTYRPGTADGQRLLAHELLHTVQNPDGLGTLRAGRGLGAVSLPQQAMEREAESTAQSLVRDGLRDRDEQSAAVEEGQATPGWLRYATVDADRQRLEQIDPATLVDRLANGVVRSLRGDPEDRSKRTRMQLVRLPLELQDAVLDRLESRLLSPEHERVLDLVDRIESDGEPELSALDAPAVEPDTAAELRYGRESGLRASEERRREEEQEKPEGQGESERDQERAPAPGHEKNADGGPPRAGAGATSTEPRPTAPQAEGTTSEKPGGEKADRGETQSPAAPEAADQQPAAAASKEESAAKNRTGAAEPVVADRQPKQEDRKGQEKPAGSPTASGKDTELPAPLSTLDGTRGQDLDGPEERADEDPFGSRNESEVEAGSDEKSAWDIKLQPEDFLPAQDLDVSAVPTADKLDPSSSATPAMPSFPAPPTTKADQVQAERDAEDAEDAAAEAATEAEETGADTEQSRSGDQPEDVVQEPGQNAGSAPAPVPLPGPGSASRDPKSGADPKAGPVSAQITVQEAPGATSGSGTAEVGGAGSTTAGGGDASGGAQEKASQEAVGGTSAAPESAAKEDQKKAPPTAPAPAPAPGAGNEATSSPEPSAPAAAKAPSSAPNPSGPATTAPAPSPTTPPPPPAAPLAESPSPAPKAKRSTPAPAAKASGGGRGGGGGAGAKAVAPAKGKKGAAPVPDLSTASPEAGLSTASKLKPHLAVQAMTGVSGAVDRTVDDEHRTLAAAPPTMQRPAGAPQTLQGAPRTDAPAQYSDDPAQRSEAPDDEKAEVTGAKEPGGEIEAEKAEEPGGWDTFKMALGFIGGKVVNKVAGFFGADKPVVDPQELAAKFAGLPTKDEALKQAQAGDAPDVEMQGAAGETSDEQGASVDAKGQETVATGRDDAARDMGERQVYPNAPKERMTAKIPGSKGGKGGAPAAGAATGSVPPEAASEVAEHERGPEFQAAFTDGQKSVSDGRQTKGEDFRDSQAKHKQQVETEIGTNTRSQTDEREKALAKVTTERTGWREEQDQELKTLGTKKTDKQEKVRKDVKEKEEKTDDDVGKEKEDGDKKIRDENTRAEKDAEKTRDDSVSESGDWVSKAFDWIKQKVIEIKNTIVRVIRQARDAVVGFIKNFKETVERWINEARKFVVDTIKNLINDLIEFAKSMVRAVIELANRIRTLITTLIETAIALVNTLANALKQIVSDLLNAIGKMLSGILDFLKKMLQAAVDAVLSAVKSVLDFASKLLSALGDWMLIAVDFLMDPGGWLSGAKNSAVDGAKNHLFREVSSAVKQWFQDKIQEIIGVPKAVLDKLLGGGMKMADIVKEAWNAVVPQLPLIIGELVMTKVVAKLIPGAGWALAVIDAIRTAWGALSAILSALGMVLDWLKAVRRGGAGILFAKAVAAGVVALLEVLYQALLTGIGKYVSKVGRRLKDVAAKLGKPKPKKPGGPRGATGEDADSRGGPRTDKQPGAQPSSQPASSATSKPPATRPAAGAVPTQKPGPGTKPGLDKPAGSGPRKPKDTDPAEPKNTDSDRNGKPKSGKDEPEPDIRPALSATPKPKDKTPDKPRDTKEPTKPKDEEKGLQKPDAKDPKHTKDKKNNEDGPDRAKDSEKSGTRKDGTRTPWTRKGDERHPRDADPAKKGQEKKDRRKKEENSKESKDARLRRIVAKIKPRLGNMLDRGVPRPVLNASLIPMRMWYRLTSLNAEGGKRFGIEATLNPKEQVLKALGITIPRRELLEFLQGLATRLEADPNMVTASQNVQLSPKLPGIVPQHTVNAPTPPPAVSRITRNDQPLGLQEQEVMNVFDEGQTSGATTPSPPAVRRQQTGPRAANKIVTGEGITWEEQSAHSYKSANKKDRKTGEKNRILGIPDEYTQQGNWPEAVEYLDNHFRAKPQSGTLDKVQRVNLLKTAWIIGNQEVDRDPMALVTNALVVQRLKKAQLSGASPARLTRMFLEIPAAFKGSERAGEILNEDVAGHRSIAGARAAIQHELDGESKEDARRRRNRERAPLNNANRLANRHVQAVSAWMKEFNVEQKVEASLNAENLAGTESREKIIKERIFHEIEDMVREMYGATERR